MSHLVRGAWIEMFQGESVKIRSASHLVRGAWIEMFQGESVKIRSASHLVRGAWIEIKNKIIDSGFRLVAPRKRCVD